MSDKCPVCNLDVAEPNYYDDKGKGMNHYSCQRCGEYNIETTFERFLPAIINNNKKKIAVLSHWIRIKYESIKNEPPDEQYFRSTIILDKKLVDTITKNQPPSPSEQANNFISWIGDNIKSANEYIAVNKYCVPAIIGSTTLDEFDFVFQHLKDTKRLILHKTAVGRGDTDLFDVTLSFHGWEYYRTLKQEASKVEKGKGSNINKEAEVSKKPEKVISQTSRADNKRNRELLKGKSMTTSGTLWKQPSPQDIWSDIHEDFDVKKLTFAKSINFVTDGYKRKAIFRDIEQAYILAKNGFSKPAVILAGSVIEELLRLYLKTKKVKPANNTFDEYIKACENSGFLKGGVNRLSDSVRHFRNLVHLEKETSHKHKISKAAAKSAVSSVFIVSSDF